MDLKTIFALEHVPYVEWGDWRSRVRPGTFTPEGVMVHHTASTNLDATLKVVTHGRPDLNGPLCNVFVAKGKCYLISAGRANHAGAGASKALDRMRHNNTPNGTARQMDYPDDFNGGNGLFVGFEVLSPGNGTELDLPSWNVLCHAAAAVLKHIGQPHHAHVIGHAEWTRRKIDPVFGRGLDGRKGAYADMQAIRQHVAGYTYIH